MQSAILLFGMSILMFSWFTYKQKLVETPAKASESDPLHNSRVVKYLYDFVRKHGRLKKTLDHAMAAAVAIDLLVISAAIRFRFEGKVTYSDGFDGPHLSFLGVAPIFELLVFAAFVFCFVWIFAFGAATIMSWRIVKGERFAIFLRFFEPLLVFWVLASTIEHFLPSGSVNTGNVFDSIFGVGPAIYAGAIWATLIVATGVSAIVEAARFSPDITTSTNESGTQGNHTSLSQEIASVAAAAFKNAGWIMLTAVAVLCLAALFLLATSGAEVGERLVGYTEWLTNGIGLLSLALLFWPGLGFVETKFDTVLKIWREVSDERASHNSQNNWRTLFGCLSAYLFSLLYIGYAVSGAPFDWATYANNPFIISLVLPAIFVASCYAMLFCRQIRTTRPNERAWTTSEIATVLGATAFGWFLALPKIRSGLELIVK